MSPFFVGASSQILTATAEQGNGFATQDIKDTFRESNSRKGFGVWILCRYSGEGVVPWVQYQ